jgi:molybdopterin-biosynthesis enzyme MoeA-like protein
LVLEQAKTFGRGVEPHEPTLNGLRDAMLKRGRGEVNEDRKCMAILPEGCETLSTSTWVPIAVVSNVYILPGIPSVVRDMLTVNDERFVGVPIHRAIVRHWFLGVVHCFARWLTALRCVGDSSIQVATTKLEGDIAAPLTAVQKAHPNVAIGSYLNPTDEKTGVKDESYNTRLTIEGRDAEEVEQVAQQLVGLFDAFRFEPSDL